MTTLMTSRFLLRQPVTTDAPAIARYLNDFGVAGNLARVPYPYHLSDAQAWLRTRRPDLPIEETNFAIDWPGLGFIGQIGFHRGEQGTVLGYWLGQPFWGKGIMTEAVAECIEWFFDATEAERLISGVFAFNAASLAIQTKLGFTQTGRSTLLCLARNAEVEHIDTEITRTAWIGRQP